MNIKKMFIGLITSVALVFSVALAPSNILETSSYGVDNLSTQRSYDDAHVYETFKGAPIPSDLPGSFVRPVTKMVNHYDKDLNLINEIEPINGKVQISYRLSVDEALEVYINGDQFYEYHENLDGFFSLNVMGNVKAKQWYSKELQNTGQKYFEMNSVLDFEGLYLLGDLEVERISYNDDNDYLNLVQNFRLYHFDNNNKVSHNVWDQIQDDYASAELYTYLHVEFDFSTDSKVPGISGETTVINNVDKPYTVERIKQIAMLSAHDEYYGDLTEQIEIVRDDYTANNKKIGDYEIEFRVENPAGLSTNFILIVANRDLVAPVITGPGTSTMSYTEEFVLSNLIAKFTVKDNHDTGVKLVHLEDDFEQGKPGVYTFRFSATDASKNESIFVHTMTVVDDQKAIITDSVEGPIEVNWRDKVTNEMLLVGLTAHDEISGELTDRLKVTNNPIKKELGTYQVEYEVTDDAGNVSKYTRTYKVITTDAPIFYVSKNLILISDVNLLTTKQIVDELARYENIQYASHMVIENEYEGNEYVVGTYKIKVAINDTKGVEHIVQRSIQVFEDSEELNTQLSLWQKIVKFFKDAWNLIKKVAITIWNAIMWLPRLIINFFKKKSLVLFLSL